MKNARTHAAEITGVGTILFEHSRRARHLSISVRPFRGVRVAVPQGMSLATAAQFVHAKLEWIRKHLRQTEKLETEYHTASRCHAAISKPAARKKLLTRLAELAAAHGFTYNRASVRNQKTRWGSCSGHNNISLNIKLLQLPDELMDLIIIHELVHTRIKNHSKEFWAALSAIIPEARDLDRRMKKHGLELLAPAPHKSANSRGAVNPADADSRQIK